MSTTDTKAELQTYLDSLGLTYIPTFRPTPQPGEKFPQLHWLITLERGKERMTFDYHQGMGHVVGYQFYYGRKTIDQQEQENRARKTCETGKLYKNYASIGFVLCGNQPAPKLIDILYCLVSDATVRHYSSYEEWAPEYGYDKDSRKGEELYKLCQKQTMDFLRVLGAGKVGRTSMDILEKLEELYQDY